MWMSASKPASMAADPDRTAQAACCCAGRIALAGRRCRASRAKAAADAANTADATARPPGRTGRAPPARPPAPPAMPPATADAARDATPSRGNGRARGLDNTLVYGAIQQASQLVRHRVAELHDPHIVQCQRRVGIEHPDQVADIGQVRRRSLNVKGIGQIVGGDADLVLCLALARKRVA